MQSIYFFAELHPYLTALTVFLVLLLVASVRIANQYERAVVFFLGRYARTSGPGLYLLIPLLGWRTTVDMRTTTTAVGQQETITRATYHQD